MLRFSDGSYLEDFDHWWLSGLHRYVPNRTCGMCLSIVQELAISTAWEIWGPSDQTGQHHCWQHAADAAFEHHCSSFLLDQRRFTMKSIVSWRCTGLFHIWKQWLWALQGCVPPDKAGHLHLRLLCAHAAQLCWQIQPAGICQVTQYYPIVFSLVNCLPNEKEHLALSQTFTTSVAHCSGVSGS